MSDHSSPDHMSPSPSQHDATPFTGNIDPEATIKHVTTLSHLPDEL